MMWKKLFVFSLLLALVVPAGATTVRPVDLGSMVDRAELIFVGTVVGSESVPTGDGSYAFTYVTFDIEQTLKGASRGGKLITLRFAGGEVGEHVFEVSGAPKFAQGGRHLLFVEGNERDGVPVIGWYQGKLDIVDHPLSRQPIVVDHSGRAIDGVKGNGWHRGGLKLGRDGAIAPPRDSGVSVVSEQGVRIVLEKPAKVVEDAAPLGNVLSDLRAFIATRKASSKAFRSTQFVESASKAKVPASFGYTAERAKEK